MTKVIDIPLPPVGRFRKKDATMLAKDHSPYRNRALEKTCEERDAAIAERDKLRADRARLVAALRGMVEQLSAEGHPPLNPTMAKAAQSWLRATPATGNARALLAELGE